MLSEKLKNLKPGCLCVEDRFPLVVQDEDSDLSVNFITAQNAETILKFLSCAPKVLDHEELSRASQDIARVEAKVDVAIALLSTMLTKSSSVPEPIPCRLYSDALVWNSGKELVPQCRISMSLFLSSTIPIPILVSGVVLDVIPEGKEFWIHAGFTRLDAAATELLERFIFLRHRQQIQSSHRK
jgi:hypothetical protein